MENDRYRVEAAFLAAANAAALLGVLLLYPFLGIWTLALGLGASLLIAVLVYRFLDVQRAIKGHEYAERFAVHRQAFELLDLYLGIAREEDDREFFRVLLDKTLSLTGAEFGFVGIVLQDESGKPFLRTRWISDIAWNEASQAAYSAQGMEFTNLDSLFGYTLRTGQHLMTNTPDEHAEAGGFPAGHPVVHSYLGVPLKKGGELIGMIGLGNRPGGFEIEDLRLWQSFFDVCSEIVRHNLLQIGIDDAHERYRQLFEEAPLMYILTEPGVDRHRSGSTSPIVVDCNTSFMDRLGYSKEEIIGRPLVDFYDESSEQMLVGGGYSRALRGGVFQEPRVLVDRNGQHIQTILKAMPIAGERGVATGTRAMFLDVSELRMAEERSRSLELSVRRFLSGANALIVEFDSDLSQLSMSAGMQRLLRYHGDHNPLPDFLSLVMDDDTRERLQSALVRVLRSNHGTVLNEPSIEVQVRSRYGDQIVLLVSLDVLGSEDGSSSVWLAAQNISESRTRARLEAETRRAASLDKLTGSIAHEFNNLFTVISRNVPVLESRSGDEEERESAAEDINSAIGEAFDLTQTLLAYSGQQVLRPSTVFLEKVLDSLIQRIRARIGSQPAITVVNEAEGYYCRIDQDKLEDLVWHIVENAIEASPPDSTIEIRVRKIELTLLDRGVFTDLIPGSYLLLCVRDAGEGISEGMLSKVEEPFFSTRRKRGLGLSNARGILKQSGGTLTIESRVGMGTNVCVWLPDESTKVPTMLSDLTRRISQLKGRIWLFSEDEALATQMINLLSSSSIEFRPLSASFDPKGEAPPDVIVLDGRLEPGEAERLVTVLGPGVRIILLDHALSRWPATQGIPGLAQALRVCYPTTSLNLVDALESALLS